eukprot:13142320-Ditylum_brightwellii.AAC.1
MGRAHILHWEGSPWMMLLDHITRKAETTSDISHCVQGSSTCWIQQWRGLKKKGVNKPNPWQQFLKDLSALIEELRGKDHEVVLSLDANEDILDGGQFTKFIKDNDLVDAFHHLHPHSNPATYLRGHKRLDY